MRLLHHVLSETDGAELVRLSCFAGMKTFEPAPESETLYQRMGEEAVIRPMYRLGLGAASRA
jgi:hypothetical protein